jgi:hypothetical protein
MEQYDSDEITMSQFTPLPPVVLYVAKEYPEWKANILQLMKNAYNAEQKSFDEVALKTVLASLPKNEFQRSMKFVMYIQKEMKTIGPEMLQLTPRLDELALCQIMEPSFRHKLGTNIIFCLASDPLPGHEDIAATAVPGTPVYAYPEEIMSMLNKKPEKTPTKKPVEKSLTKTENIFDGWKYFEYKPIPDEDQVEDD